jgi:hypothetical protein
VEVEILEKLMADWNRFQDDKASFEQWLNVNFGMELCQARESEAMLREKGGLLSAIQTEVESGRAKTYRAAYAGIKKRRIGSSPFTHPNAGQAPAAVDDGKVKQLHRILARRLHPDTRTDGDATAPELWHEADAAYTAKDVERLEVLVAMTTVQSNGLGADTSLEEMRSMFAKLRDESDTLCLALKAAEEEPAWNFRLLKDRSHLAVWVRDAIESQIRDFQGMILNMEEMLAEFSQPSEPSSRFGRAGRWAAY